MLSSVRTYIQEKLPKGISLRKGKDLYVKQSKTVDGKDKPFTLSKVVKLGIKSTQTEAEQKKEFEIALEEALNVKRQMTNKLANRRYIENYKPQQLGTGTLDSVFNRMKSYTWSGKQLEHNEQYFDDLCRFFGKDKKLNTFNIFELEDFKIEVKQYILNRDKNMRSSVSNSSINKRLGCLRMILREAIKYRLLDEKDLPNPDSRVKNMGIVDLTRGESQKKPALTIEEESKLLSVVELHEDQFWHDFFTCGFNLGARHTGEMNQWNIDNVDFGRGTIQFYRPKTDSQSVEFKLNQDLLDIFKRRRKDALQNKDNRFFPVSSSSIRSAWWKYVNKCKFHKKFTPYCMRHTFVTRLAEAGESPKVVKELAGHKRIETTLTYYTDTPEPLLNKALENLEAYKKKNTVVSMIGHNSRKQLK